MGVLKDSMLVVLLHGIGGTRMKMVGMERALRRHGHDTLNMAYPSLRFGIDGLAEFVDERLEREGAWQREKVHFVCHSMGGLVIRHYLEKRANNLPSSAFGRFVMLAPPNGGSEIADLLHGTTLYKWAYGPAGQELRTEARSDRGAPPGYETGVIAGMKWWHYPAANLFLSRGGHAHDGRVRVERTGLDGMKDHIVLPAAHGSMAWRRDVQDQTAHFIEHGTFHHAQQQLAQNTGIGMLNMIHQGFKR